MQPCDGPPPPGSLAVVLSNGSCALPATAATSQGTQVCSNSKTAVFADRAQSGPLRTAAECFPGDDGRWPRRSPFTFEPLSALLHLSRDVTEGFVDPSPAVSHATADPGRPGAAGVRLDLCALLHGVQILPRDKTRARSSSVCASRAEKRPKLRLRFSG